MRLLNSLIVLKYLKKGTLGFFEHPFCSKLSEKPTLKTSKSLKVPKNVEKGTLLLWNGFAFHVRGFGCVKN